MAEKKMAEIEQETRAHWPVGDMALVHRLGHLGVGGRQRRGGGELSAPGRLSTPAATPSTGQGMVPIWKKENWTDGTTEWCIRELEGFHGMPSWAWKNDRTTDRHLWSCS